VTRVGIITQARTTSTRLPRKVLIEVAGKTLLDHHLDRLAASRLPVLVATTSNATDDEIAALAAGRFHECAEENGLDVVVRVTSDCPLIDGELIASAVQEYVEADDPWLYLSNALERTFPRGFDFEVFSAKALADAHAHAGEAAQREHVTPYLYANGSGRIHLRNIAWREDKSGYRVTLDTPDDLALIRALIEDHQAASLPCGEIIGVLDQHPELVAINRHVEQKKLGE
jgi:spore coat polysaccharide biosynthesis protein SpsF